MKNKSIPLIALIAASFLLFKTSDISKKRGNLNNYTLEQKIEQDTVYNSTYYSIEELKQFDKWVDSTLKESKIKNSNSIIVNKLKKELYLITNGEVHSMYNIDLGFGPIKDKQKEGDGCTPEGMYVVQRKLPSGNTNFYKAFLINYPNKQDKAKDKTGSLIEIHGGGGLGYDWTLGCMALTNKDMDKIFPYINEGDRITIIRDNSKKLILE